MNKFFIYYEILSNGCWDMGFNLKTCPICLFLVEEGVTIKLK